MVEAVSKPRDMWVIPHGNDVNRDGDVYFTDPRTWKASGSIRTDLIIHVREVLPDTVSVPRELMELIRGWVLSYAILTEREGAANCVAEMNHLLHAFDEAQKREGE